MGGRGCTLVGRLSCGTVGSKGGESPALGAVNTRGNSHSSLAIVQNRYGVMLPFRSYEFTLEGDRKT